MRTTMMALVAVQCYLLAGTPVATNAETVAFEHGRWLGEDTFEEGTWYSVDGTLSKIQPEQIDEIVELGGGFVIPAYGEAHNHNIISQWTLENEGPRYLKEGILWVRIPGGVPLSSLADLRKAIEDQGTFEVSFGSAGITRTGGHPEPLYKRLIKAGHRQGVSADSLDGELLFAIDSTDELEQRWSEILSYQPDFIKTLLLFSGPDSILAPRAGLHPEVQRRAVELAHESGFRVLTHVETASDFDLAVESGCNEIAHLPGYSYRPTLGKEAYLISEESAAIAAERDVIVVTTGVWSREFQKPESHAVAREIQKANLRTLHAKGVRLAIGSDTYQLTSAGEAMYLHELGVFDNETLLRIWCQDTPRAIFPERKIGAIQPGHEASFTVLNCHPFEDFLCVNEVRLVVKDGRIVEQ